MIPMPADISAVVGMVLFGIYALSAEGDRRWTYLIAFLQMTSIPSKQCSELVL